jgi:hypothetical protein
MAAKSGATVHELRQRAEQIGAETRALGSTLEATWSEVESLVRDSMQQHPYATMLVAGSVGYVLGGGLPSVLTRTLMAMGGRLAVEMAARQLGARLAAENGQGAAEVG